LALSRELSYTGEPGEESAESLTKIKSYQKMKTLLPITPVEWAKRQTSMLSVSYKRDSHMKTSIIEEASGMETTKFNSMRMSTQMGGEEEVHILIPDENFDGTCGDRYGKLEEMSLFFDKLSKLNKMKYPLTPSNQNNIFK